MFIFCVYINSYSRFLFDRLQSGNTIENNAYYITGLAIKKLYNNNIALNNYIAFVRHFRIEEVSEIEQRKSAILHLKNKYRVNIMFYWSADMISS